MQPSELPATEFKKYTAFINRQLEKEEALAAISYRLQQHGAAPEIARQMIKDIALSQSLKVKNKAMLNIGLGLAGTILFSIIGLTSKRGEKYFLIAIGSLLGGLYHYYSSSKRVR